MIVICHKEQILQLTLMIFFIRKSDISLNVGKVASSSIINLSVFIRITDTVPIETLSYLNSSFFDLSHKVDAVSRMERAKGTDGSSSRSTSFISNPIGSLYHG